MSEQPARQSLFRDLGVRIAIAYFGIFWIYALFDSGDTPRRIWNGSWGVLSEWIAKQMFGAEGAIRFVSSDARYALSQHVLAIVVAMIVAFIWTKVSRTSNGEKREGALRLMLRYYMGVVVMVYAGAKVVPLQFPHVNIEDMARPLGGLAPMGMLWSFMGYSPVYTVFAGLAEWSGAFLLFFRRTTTLGALILLGVLSNVALMNYAYDVPVKVLSVNLSLMAATLVALDARRLRDVFLYNRPASSSDLSRTDMPRWLMKARPVLKPLLVVLASVAPIVATSFIYRNVYRSKSPLYGVYAVTHSDSAARGQLSSWTHVTFAVPTTMTVSFSSDSVVRYQASVDTAARTIRYWDLNANADAKRSARTLQYRRNGANDLMVTSGADTVALRSIDPRQRYRLARAR